MEERSDVNKSAGSDVFMPTAIVEESADDYDKESADDTEEGSGNCWSDYGRIFSSSRKIALLFPYLFKSFCIRIPCNLEFEF
jgi:hypothetical protein